MRKYRGIRYQYMKENTVISHKWVVYIYLGGKEYAFSSYDKKAALALAFSAIDKFREGY